MFSSIHVMNSNNIRKRELVVDSKKFSRKIVITIFWELFDIWFVSYILHIHQDLLLRVALHLLFGSEVKQILRKRRGNLYRYFFKSKC